MEELAQIRFIVPADVLEPLLNMLTEDGGGVEQRDADTLNKATSGSSEVVAWLPSAQVEERVKRVEILIGSLKEMGLTTDPWSWETEDTEARAWSEAYKEFFPVIHLGRFLVIKPSWKEYEAAPHEQVIEMDPGQAFGTGLHASTTLMVRAMERLARRGTPPTTVLDLGTGTGILAMAAARLWADAEIVAIDSDPVAVEVCRTNLEANGLSGRVELKEASALEFPLKNASTSLIVANLTRDLLLTLRPRLAKPLEEFGHLVVSGLLSHEANEVCRAYSQDLTMEPELTTEQDGWTAVIFRVRY